MKAPRNPRRLIHDPELGCLVRAAAESRLEPERLERSRQEILGRIAEAEASGRTVRPILRTGPRRVLQAAVPLLLLVCATAGALIWLARPPTRMRPETAAPAAPARGRGHPPAAGRDVSIDELLEIGSGYEPPPTGAPRPEPPAAPGPVAGLAPPPAPQPAPSARLQEQIALFRKARRAAHAGDLDQATGLLDELARRFPKSPLGAEARVLRVEVLYRQGRYPQAIERIEPLLELPELAGKKAQLLRLLGDAWLQLGRCERATDAFRRALGLGLQGAEARAARRGLEQCARRQPDR